MIIISIDIGRKNLGYTIASAVDFNKAKINDVKFISGVYDLNEKPSKGEIVLQRILALKIFFEITIKDDVFCAIIERQVPSNLIAMELMYSVVSFISKYTNNIYIFDPKLKFNTIGQTYNTRNKEHKKQSINNMYKFISSVKNPCFNELETLLKDAKKRDDIADSFNQLIIYACMNEYIDLDISELKKLF